MVGAHALCESEKSERPVTLTLAGSRHESIAKPFQEARSKGPQLPLLWVESSRSSAPALNKNRHLAEREREGGDLFRGVLSSVQQKKKREKERERERERESRARPLLLQRLYRCAQPC